MRRIRGREWWLVEPMGGVQTQEGIEARSHMVDESLLGVSAWRGPCWPLGRGWMLGLHARVTGVRGDVQLLGNPDTGSEVALRADISFQSH